MYMYILSRQNVNDQFYGQQITRWAGKHRRSRPGLYGALKRCHVHVTSGDADCPDGCSRGGKHARTNRWELYVLIYSTYMYAVKGMHVAVLARVGLLFSYSCFYIDYL